MLFRNAVLQFERKVAKVRTTRRAKKKEFGLVGKRGEALTQRQEKFCPRGHQTNLSRGQQHAYSLLPHAVGSLEIGHSWKRDSQWVEAMILIVGVIGIATGMSPHLFLSRATGILSVSSGVLPARGWLPGDSGAPGCCKNWDENHQKVCCQFGLGCRRMEWQGSTAGGTISVASVSGGSCGGRWAIMKFASCVPCFACQSCEACKTRVPHKNNQGQERRRFKCPIQEHLQGDDHAFDFGRVLNLTCCINCCMPLILPRP